MTTAIQFSFLFLFLAFAFVDDAQSQSRFEEFRDQLEPWLGDVPDAEHYSSCSAKEAFRILALFSIAPGPGFEGEKEAVASAARKNDKLREFLTDKLLSTPVSVENSESRFPYFYALSYLKSDWATKLAGDLLVKDAPLRNGEIETIVRTHHIYEGNHWAAWVIGVFEYPGYPSKEHMFQYEAWDVYQCRSWWIENVITKSK